MTARSKFLVAAAIAAAVVGCDRDPRSEQPKSRADRDIDKAIDKLAAQDIETRSSGAFVLALMCCDLSRDSWLRDLPAARPRACRELAAIFETSADPQALEGALIQATPSCRAAIPPHIVYGICRNGCGTTTQHGVNYWLEGSDPSAQLTRAILAEVYPSKPGRDAIKNSVWSTLSNYGEADLGPVVDAMTHPDRLIRNVALSTLRAAISNSPLDFPKALEALERATSDPDRGFALYAEVTIERYRSQSQKDPDAVVAEWAASDMTYQQIRMLGTRRFSCRAASAVTLLEELINGTRAAPARYSGSATAEHAGVYEDIIAERRAQQTIEARRALATRAKRCATEPRKPL